MVRMGQTAGAAHFKASWPGILTWGSLVIVAPGRDGGTNWVDAYASPFKAKADVPRAQWAEVPGLASHGI
jgi:hypothetical protein